MATNFELSYAGVGFLVPDEGVLDKARAWLHIEDKREAWSCHGNSPKRGTFRSGTDEYRIPDWLDLYELYVPVGASRFSVFRGLATKAQADAMLAAYDFNYIGASYMGKGRKLVMKVSLDTERTTAVTSEANFSASGGITAYMHPLPPKPVFLKDSATTLYLITLVDNRYFWQYMPSTTPSYLRDASDSAGFSWNGLLETLKVGSYGGAGWSNAKNWSSPTPDSVYGSPDFDSDLWSFWDDNGTIVDSALGCVGSFMFSRSNADADKMNELSPTYSIARWEDSIPRLNEVKAILSTKQKAGGQSWSSDMATTSKPRSLVLPQRVRVVFPAWSAPWGYDEDLTGGPSGYPQPSRRERSNCFGADKAYSKTWALSDLGSPFSSMTAWGDGVSGSPSKTEFVIQTTARAKDTNASGLSPSNQTELDDLAEQLAKDYYWHMMNSDDVVYNGLGCASATSHGCDVIYSYLGAQTRIASNPVFRHQSEMSHRFSDTDYAPYWHDIPSAWSGTLASPSSVPGTGSTKLTTLALEPGTYQIQTSTSYSTLVAQYWTVVSGSNNLASPGISAGQNSFKWNDTIIVASTSVFELYVYTLSSATMTFLSVQATRTK